jgi:hypothetical protein
VTIKKIEKLAINKYLIVHKQIFLHLYLDEEINKVGH